MARRLEEQVTLGIRALSHEGRGITEYRDKTLFVPDALPNETVRLEVRTRRRKMDARVLEVLEPAAERVAPKCAAFGVCGGCVLQHLDHAGQVRHKQQVLVDALERIAKVECPPLAQPIVSEPWHYRRKARLGVKHVFGKGRVLVGFRERLKPYIADMQRCEVLHAQFADLPAQLAELIEGLSIRERLPQVELAAGDNSAALVFRVLDEPSSDDLDRLRAFGESANFSIWLQPGGPNSLQLLTGSEFLSYRLPGGLALEFSPLDFVQVNSLVNHALIERAMLWLELAPEHHVLDLFCGLGNFTLPIASQVTRVVGVEGADSLVAKAQHNAARNDIRNSEFHAADLTKVTGLETWLQPAYDRVLLDPARAGAAEILPIVAKGKPSRIVYVSCHPATLARDVGQLVHEYGYQLGSAGIADMFPHTGHVESIVALSRS